MKKSIWIAILVMGFSGLVAEILLLRELLVIFSGNELCIGIILANWLILEAFGCFFLGRNAEQSKHTLETFTVITILFSLFLPVAIFLTRILKIVIGVSVGESIGFLPIFYSSFLILAPVSILHGVLFPYSCRIYAMVSGREASSAGKVYVYETLGTMIGGIVCTWFFIPYIDSFQASIGLAVLNAIVCFVIILSFLKTGRLKQTILVLLCVLIFYGGYIIIGGQAEKLHLYSITMQWKNLDVVHYQNSQYGNICIVENQGQYIFFQDGIPNLITPVPDFAFIEEFVHIPLLIHPEPVKLLILSGGAGGVINEIFKHASVESIDYAELDPLLIDLLRKFPTPLTESELNNNKVTITHIDGRMFLNKTKNTYDVIFLGIQEPSNLQTNRFFTKEFFNLVKKRLHKDGILVLGLPGSLMYTNQELKNLNSCIYNTLNNIFSNIRVFPGDGTNIFLSSQSRDISMIDRNQIIERLYRRNIRQNTTAPLHIEKKLHDGWRDWFSNFIEGGSQKINSDYNPMGMFYSIAHWNALFAPSLRWVFGTFDKLHIGFPVIAFVIIITLYFLLQMKRRLNTWAVVSLSIFTTGFAGMIFDLMIIFTFQSMYGYVFSWIGLLVASFMAGAAFGALLITKALERIKNMLKVFIKIDLAIICITVGWPVLLFAIDSYPDSPGGFFVFRILFLVISFIGGMFTGAQFPLANKIYMRNNTSLSKSVGMLYAADLFGGWFGGIAGAIILLPVLGLSGTCITVGLFKLTSLIPLLTESKLQGVTE